MNVNLIMNYDHTNVNLNSIRSSINIIMYDIWLYNYKCLELE